MLVPKPVWIQPFPPPTGKVQSMLIDEMVTPPPAQLLTFNIPATSPFAGVDKSRAANMAMTIVPMCFIIVSPYRSIKKTRCHGTSARKKESDFPYLAYLIEGVWFKNGLQREGRIETH